jgi:cytoskeletal protein CcmA (bactofilin family)
MWKPASSPSSTTKNTTPEIQKPLVNTAPEVANEPVPAPAPRTVNVSSQEQATIGKSLVIKGEVTGSESLYVDGRVEGAINLPGHRVTVGRNGQVQANVNAKEIVVLGKIKGNVTASDRVDIRNESSLTGDVVCQRISIEDGAFFKGSIDIRKPGLKDVNPATKLESTSADMTRLNSATSVTA